MIMKTKHILSLAWMLTAVMALTACNDWLDVEPKSQIKEDKQFSREGGYKDQLTGVYTAMATPQMYGQNMGIGFVEVLSHSYNVSANGKWRYANDFDYTQSTSKSTIDEIWRNTYNCIANLNILIRNIDKADSTRFTGNHYHIYRGEAYGLRAFLHLDLMRLFAAAPGTDAEAKGGPYVTEYATNVVPQKSVKETMQLIISDLLTAHQELSHDSLRLSKNRYQFRADRSCYFNYYACALTLARAYLWDGDKTNALKYANEVIHAIDDKSSTSFSWIDYTDMQQTALNELDMAFTTEHLFHLTVNNWEDIANYYFAKKGGDDVLNPSDATQQDIYEVSRGLGNDYRYLKGYTMDGDTKYLCKFWHVEGGKYNDLYPLLRMIEAWYIAAECLEDSDPAKAVELLNEVRDNRNLKLFPLDSSLTPQQIQQEIYKEYRKEFVGEGGQLFFYYKRRNAQQIAGTAIKPGKSVYVLPIPENDVEFGGYDN